MILAFVLQNIVMIRVEKARVLESLVLLQNDGSNPKFYVMKFITSGLFVAFEIQAKKILLSWSKL